MIAQSASTLKPRKAPQEESAAIYDGRFVARRAPPRSLTKILCIEDDRETAALLLEELIERGYVASTVHSGRDGLAAILAEAPDLVLCDLSMPDMSGFEVLERLTALAPRHQDMPFVFLTALTDRESELRGRQLGADDYVAKPIDFEVLASIIRARLASVARRDIWPQDIDLTQREVEMLTWAARGKTRDEIAEIVGISRRTVEYHLENARAKLGVATRIQAVVKAVAGNLIQL
jgi:DNA-binding NarL/FixJ family response regulator